MTDKLSHRLRLVKEVSLELSKESGDDEKVVMWVFDSFSDLVSGATRSNDTPNAMQYGGVIWTLFSLNTAIIPVAVCDSAATSSALRKSKLKLFKLLF